MQYVGNTPELKYLPTAFRSGVNPVTGTVQACAHMMASPEAATEQIKSAVAHTCR